MTQTHTQEPSGLFSSGSEATLPAMRLVHTPRVVWRVARALIILFFVLPLAVLLLPWQQTITASGRLMAFSPVDRQQFVKAPIDARVMKWLVVEGQSVEKGDVLVEMNDPDPKILAHIMEEKQAIETRVRRSELRVKALEEQMASLEGSREQAIKGTTNRMLMTERRLQSAREAEKAARATNELAIINFNMQDGLYAKGLTSRLELEQAKQRKVTAEAELERALQARYAAENEVDALKADLGKVTNDADAALAGLRALLESGEAEIAAGQRDLAGVKIRLNRQETQQVTSPCKGNVFRVLANASNGGQLIKAGDNLCIIVPDIPENSERAVELFLEGLDAPLITQLLSQRSQEGNTEPLAVRLQFEGWPAVQFMGWPSLSIGTFGGRLEVVDATDDGKGKFRVLVKPDPDEESINPWPSDFNLRQGVRANGWLFLNRVTIGWELWRYINGFPPVLADQEKTKEKLKFKVSQ